MKSLKYILLLLIEITYSYSYGQLNLSSLLSAGQYYNPVSVNAQPGMTAHGSSGIVHLFINAVPVSTTTTYATQSQTNILSNEAALSETMPNTSLAVGKTPYSYGVSPTGAGTYTVPIVIPPGTMGMVPKLSIVYSSQSVEGLLGYGWNLAGLSSISRLGRTPYHNFGGAYPDQTQGVTLTDSDWFALDGNRLIKTVTGTYGSNGLTYATESETFNLITSNGTVGNGPEWFKVKTKSGLTMEYGRSLDSRLVPVGQSTVFVWNIDKITDQFGNYMTFKYMNNDGEACIQEIDYTGNTNAGFTPYNSVVFSYKNKTETNTTYIADGALNSTLILDNITINSHGSFFKEYSFKYTTNLYTLLQEIDETGSDHTSVLNPLQFSYGSDGPVVGSACGSGGLPSLTYNNCVEADPYALGGIADGASGFQEAAQFTLLDFNGDGKTDVISLNGTYNGVGETEGEEYQDPCGYSNYAFTWTSQVLYTSGISCPYFTSAYTFTSYPTTISSSTFETPVSNASTASLNQTAGDFNGDGKDDYAVSTFNFSSVAEGADAEEDIHVALSTGSSFATANTIKAYDMYNNSFETTSVYAPANTTLSTVLYLDLNGDGQMDIFNYHFNYLHDTSYYRVWLNAGASSTTPQEQLSSSYTVTPTLPTSPNFEIRVYEGSGDYLDFSHAIPMDLNGDGKTELVNVYRRGLDPTQRVIVSFDATQTYGHTTYVAELDGASGLGRPGNGIVVLADTSSFQYNTNTYVPNTLDSAGVGYCPGEDDETYTEYYPTDTYGKDNVYGNITSINNGSGTPYVLFGDFNGDGITDVLTYSSGSGSWTMHPGKGQGSYASLPVSTLSSDNPFSYPTYFYYAVDVNGDGKTDILEFIPDYSGTNTLIKTYYSTGTSFVAGANIIVSGRDINPQTWQIAFGDFNGDGTTDVLLENNLGTGVTDGGPLILYFYAGTQSRRMVQAVDGYNNSTEFTYQPITNSAIYSKPRASSYRSVSVPSSMLDIQEPIYVVSRLTTTDGTGNHTTTSLSKDGNSNYITYTDTTTTTYTYQDAIYCKNGLGFLGFLEVTSYNSATDYSTSSTNNILSPFFTLVPSTYTTTAVSLATTVSDGSYSYSSVSLGGLRYFLPETGSVANDDVAGVKATTTYTYTSDNHGNMQEKKTQISIISNSNVVETMDVQNTYTTSATWIPAAVATCTTTATYLSNPSYTRALSNSWDGAGHLTSSTADPSTGEAVTTTNTYDANTGALTKQVVSSADGTCPTYTTTCAYDGYSQFKTASTNALGQSTIYSYNAMWGKPASITTPDGLTTTYQYDAFGRSSQITTPDGLVQTLTYAWVSPTELPLGSGSDPFDITHTSLYSVTSAKSGSPTIETFYDWFDRQTLLATNTISADVYKEQSYDALGHDYQSTDMYQKTSISATYGDYDPVTITKAYSDVEHRITGVTSTCGSAPTLSTTYSYTASALGNTTVKVTKPDGTASSQTTDPAGFLVNSTDYEYGSPATAYSTVNYSYFSNGHAASVVLNSNTVNSFTYDAYGRQAQMHDINFVNYYTYHYNAYNELVTMQDPNGNTCTMTYDALGRTSGKTSSLEGAYTYTYVASGNGLDLLQSEQVGSNTISYTYDALRRVTQVDVNGLTTSYTYDAYNNVQTKTYPGGFGITNYYTTDGYLTSTYKTGGALIWNSATMNPFGQYVDYTLGNGTHTIKSYTPYDYLNSISGGSYENIAFDYDPTNGNLLSRISNSNLTESFSYDPMLNNRLAEAQAYYPCSSVAGESAPDKTADVTMTYDLNGNITGKLDICAPSTYYTNANSNNQPTEVPNSNSYISAGQSVSYSSFNAPTSIALGTYTLTFTYGPDNNREETQLSDGTNTTTRYYAQDYEKTLVNGSNPVEINYVPCGGDLVAMYVNQTSGGNMYYTYTDQVGSILTVTDGTNTYNQSFDAWGNYRSATNGSYAGTPPGGNPSWLYRGFTGHEHLAEMQLINANGRLYDPFINSMLSPDAFVQDPGNTQNYNRYNYCMNNPLKYTDPSGFLYSLTPEMAEAQRDINASLEEIDEMDNAWITSLGNGLLMGGSGTGFTDGYVSAANETGAGLTAADWVAGNDPLNGIGTFAYGLAYTEGMVALDESIPGGLLNALRTANQTSNSGSAPNSNTLPQLPGTTSATPGQQAAILGADNMTLPPVTTYGVTPSPTATGDGSSLTSVAGAIAVYGDYTGDFLGATSQTLKAIGPQNTALATDLAEGSDALEFLGPVALGYGLKEQYDAYHAGEITEGQFLYNGTSMSLSYGIGLAYGPLAGLAVGGTLGTAPSVYQGTNYYITNLNTGFANFQYQVNSGGWIPIHW